jgi:hypothetical protein
LPENGMPLDSFLPRPAEGFLYPKTGMLGKRFFQDTFFALGAGATLARMCPQILAAKRGR